MESTLIHTFSQSGWVGKFIMFSLFAFSILTWGVIAKKIKEARDRKKETEAFLKMFHSDADFFSIRSNFKGTAPITEVFNAGIDHLLQFVGFGQEAPAPQTAAHSSSVAVAEMAPAHIELSRKEVSLIEGALERKITQQLMKLDQFNVVLAITSAAGPLFGLLGTVWGIMEAFRSMGTAGNASIAVVAPGISEALVTTVAGLMVAIPALIAFNVIVNEVKKQAINLENFAAEFLSLIKQRYLTK
jgi:biopolymer transport protein ExbB/TolQ